MTKSAILHLEGLPIGHLERTGQLADAGITRSTQRHFHQSKQRAEQALGRTQGKAENPYKHQEGTNGLISVVLAVPSQALMILVEPVVHCIRVYPEGERARLIRDWSYYDQLTTG